MPGFWDNIFGQLTPQYPDQSVGAEPTATERQGLLGSIVGTMWDDPIALSGFRGDVVDWDRTTMTPEHIGEYYDPRSLETPDTIRFNQGGLGALRLPGPPAMTPIEGPRVSLPAETMTRTAQYLPAIERPDFPVIGRHEFRHRGMNLLPAAAREYGVQFRDNPRARLSEQANVYQDRQLGYGRSYEDLMNFSPQDEQFYSALLERLRGAADRVNAARVQRMINTGGRWNDQP